MRRRSWPVGWRSDPSAGFVHAPQYPPESEEEQHRRKGHGQSVGYRLRHVDGGGLVGGEQHRHQVDQRQQQNELAHHGHNDGLFGFAQGGKGHLAGHLNTEQEQHRHIERFDKLF